MSFEEDSKELSDLGTKYADSFIEISKDEDPENDSDRLWKWMAQLINDSYHIGWKSGRKERDS